jgi:hypothetical protein
MTSDQPQPDRFGREHRGEELPHSPAGYIIEVWCYECSSYVKQRSVPPADPELKCDHDWPGAIDPDGHDVDRLTLLAQQIKDIEQELNDPATAPGWRPHDLERLQDELIAELEELWEGRK